MFFINTAADFVGAPKARLWARISWLTKLLAPIADLSPIVTPGRIVTSLQSRGCPYRNRKRTLKARVPFFRKQGMPRGVGTQIWPDKAAFADMDRRAIHQVGLTVDEAIVADRAVGPIVALEGREYLTALAEAVYQFFETGSDDSPDCEVQSD